MKKLLILIFIAGSIIILKCQVPNNEYKLVWEDNFDGLELNDKN